MSDSAIYIHIPFCDHKCIYCDFYSIITSDNIVHFLNGLITEIKTYSLKYSEGRKFSSIFFGGGTPSLMTPEYLAEIISSLKKYFEIKEDAEITMETNPGTVDENKLQDFRKAGVNRISIGIQSFDENELKFLTRIHDRETAVRTVLNAAAAGFENISTDLIFNLPKQTKQIWLKNLETAVTLPINHLSAYSLILERGTILNKMVLDGKIVMQDDDYDADLYEMTIDFMEDQGFGQYEVSNFAKPGFECVHNNAYWRYRDYLSFGPSAHSFVGGKRWWNYSSLKRYLSEIGKNGTAVAGSESVSSSQMLDEYVMLALRSSGLDKIDFTERFGGNWLNEKINFFEDLNGRGLAVVNGDYIRLTKKGYALCDEILTHLL